MILQAGYNCWLTQKDDVTAKDRRFESHVVVHTAEDFEIWKEITSRQKDEMVMMNALLDVDAMSYESLTSAEKVIHKVQDGITKNINAVPLTAEQAIEKKNWFPVWEDLIGTEVDVQFRFRYDGTLYEVVQKHTLQEGWKPGTGTEPLYKVVQADVSGKQEEPIPWEKGMELEEGKYYKDNEVTYLCVRSSEMGMHFALADLVSGGFVSVVNEETKVDTVLE